MSRGTISLLEQDQCYSSLAKVMSITKVLGIGLNEYFGFRPNKPVWEERGEDGVGAFAEYLRTEVYFLTKEELARRSGVSTATIYCLETGRRDPYTLTVLLLAEALHITPDEYIGNPCLRSRKGGR